MARQDHMVEPSVPTFSPDNKWVIFTGNMTGSTYVYAVEVKTTKPTSDVTAAAP